MDLLTARRAVVEASANRDRKIRIMLRAGTTITAIGQALGITRQRAQQLVKRIRR